MKPYIMTRLILLPGLAGDAVMWQAQLTALAAWDPVVADVHMRHDSVPAMAAALLAETTGSLVLCGASEQPLEVNAALLAWLEKQAPPGSHSKK